MLCAVCFVQVNRISLPMLFLLVNDMPLPFVLVNKTSSTLW